MLRRGIALAELVVAMAMLGVVGAIAASALAQQGEVRRRVTSRVADAIQAREALAPLVADLELLSPAAGDIPPGGARDSTLDLRATVLAGTICAIDSSDVRRLAVAAPADGRSIDEGDSLWVYGRTAAGVARWRGVPLADARLATAGGCTSGPGTVNLTLATVPTEGLALTAGMPVRVTRRARYSFYRASDGHTYLGLREWSASLGALAGVQPVAGPFDRKRSGFAYLDDGGAAHRSGDAETERIRAVRVTIAPVGAQPAFEVVTLLRGGA